MDCGSSVYIAQAGLLIGTAVVVVGFSGTMSRAPLLVGWPLDLSYRSSELEVRVRL